MASIAGCLHCRHNSGLCDCGAHRAQRIRPARLWRHYPVPLIVSCLRADGSERGFQSRPNSTVLEPDGAGLPVVVWQLGLMDALRGRATHRIARTVYGGLDPLYSRGAVHGGGGAASAPVGGKETLPQHLELPHVAGVVGVPLCVYRLPGRVCCPQRRALQSPLRLALSGGKSGHAGGTRHLGMEGARGVEGDLLESLHCFGTLHRRFDDHECSHCSRSISHRQRL